MALPTRCIYQVSNWYLKAYWKKVQKTFRWLVALLTPPSECFVRQRAKNCPTMTKNSRGQNTHYISAALSDTNSQAVTSNIFVNNRERCGCLAISRVVHPSDIQRLTVLFDRCSSFRKRLRFYLPYLRERQNIFPMISFFLVVEFLTAICFTLFACKVASVCHYRVSLRYYV